MSALPFWVSRDGQDETEGDSMGLFGGADAEVRLRNVPLGPLRRISTAEALKEVYFQDGGRRAGSLQEVQINDVLDLEFEL